MDSEDVLPILILIAIAFLGLKSIGIKRKDEKKQREHQLARSQILNQIETERPTSLPGFMRHAINEFINEYKGSSQFNNEEISPLKYYGYTVGKTKGRSLNERRQIMKVTFHSDMPDIFPSLYKQKWGEAGTSKRYDKIVQHIKKQADQRRTNSSYCVAVSHWDEDWRWFSQTYYSMANHRRNYGL